MGLLDRLLGRDDDRKRGFYGKGATSSPGFQSKPKTMSQPKPVKATASGYTGAKGNAHKYHASGAKAYTGTAQGYDGAQGDASEYTADQRDVAPNATVRKQMEDLLSSDSKYLKTARHNADQASNSRGLLFSSMAAGAGEKAAIEAAMPIATQDASTYHNQSLTNQQAVNAERQYNAGNRQQMELANMDSRNQADRFTAEQSNAMSQFNAGQRQQNSQFNADARNRAGEFNATNRQQMELANMDSTNQSRQFNANAEMEMSQFNATQANNMAQNQWSQLSSQAHEKVMKELDASSRERLIEFEKKWDRVIEQDKLVSTAYATAMQSLGTAMSNGQLSTEQQKRAAEEITSQLEAYMGFTQKIGGQKQGNGDAADKARGNQNDAVKESQRDREAAKLIEKQEAQMAEQTAQMKKLQEQIAAIQQAQRRKSEQWRYGA